MMIRTTLNVAWPVMGGSRWVLRAVDRFGLVFIGLVWLVYVIFVEQYYRSGVTAVRMRRDKEREHPALQAEATRAKGLRRMLRRLGLDILARRLVPTIGIPLAVLLVTYLVYQLIFAILGR